MSETNKNKYTSTIRSRDISRSKASSFDANEQKNKTDASNTETSEATTNGFSTKTSTVGSFGTNAASTSTAGSLFGGAGTGNTAGGFGFGQKSTSSTPFTGFRSITGDIVSTFSFGGAKTKGDTDDFVFKAVPPLPIDGIKTATGTKSKEFGATRTTELSVNTFGTCNAFANTSSSGPFNSSINGESVSTGTENRDQILFGPKINQRIITDSKNSFTDLPFNVQKLLQDVEQYKSQQKRISDGLKSAIEEARKNLDVHCAKFKNTESQMGSLEKNIKSEGNQDKADASELKEQTENLQQGYQNVNGLQNEYSQLAEIEETLEYFSTTSKSLEQRVSQALETLKLLNQFKANQTSSEVVQGDIQSYNGLNNNLTDRVPSNNQAFSSGIAEGSDATKTSDLSSSTFETSSIVTNTQTSEVSSNINTSKSAPTGTENSDQNLIDPKAKVNNEGLSSNLPLLTKKLLQDVKQYRNQQKRISDGLKSAIKETRKSLDDSNAKFKNVKSQTSNLGKDTKSEENQDKTDVSELNEQTKDLQQDYQSVDILQNEYSQLAEIEETLDYFSTTSKTLEQHVSQALETLKLLNQQIYTLSRSKANQNDSKGSQKDIQSQHPVVIDLTGED